MVIKHADVKHVIDCADILQNSEIGKVYFGDYEKTVELLSNASVKQELYIAANENEESLGFIYYKSKGMFGSYPYLHIIAVKEEYRGLGIGKQLIKYFEENASDYSVTKCFLTVDDFNLKAKKWYEAIGYQCVGELTDFYKEEITSYIMMKTISNK